jgi:alpha-glucosidase
MSFQMPSIPTSAACRISPAHHARYHNVYGMQMVRATREGLLAARPDRRPFILSRANYLGGHRYAATWSGDNSSDWAHLAASIPMTLNLGLSGQPFNGPDIGGFSGNATPALFARWMGIGALLPFCRGHSDKGTLDHEPWAFDRATTDSCREAISRRYHLLPYLYTLFHVASVSGVPVARPVFFADPRDPALRGVDHQFLLGDGLLVHAHVTEGDAPALRLPRGAWREFLHPTSGDNPRLFIRGGTIIPAGPALQHTGQSPLDPLILYVTLDDAGGARGVLYEDEGDGFAYQRGDFRLATYTARTEGSALVVHVESSSGDRRPGPRALVVRVIRSGGVLEARGVDGTPLVLPID